MKIIVFFTLGYISLLAFQFLVFCPTIFLFFSPSNEIEILFCDRLSTWLSLVTFFSLFSSAATVLHRLPASLSSDVLPVYFCIAGPLTCPAGPLTCPAVPLTCPAGPLTCPAGPLTCPAGHLQSTVL